MSKPLADHRQKTDRRNIAQPYKKSISTQTAIFLPIGKILVGLFARRTHVTSFAASFAK